jgi:hypothetical protein
MSRRVQLDRMLSRQGDFLVRVVAPDELEPFVSLLRSNIRAEFGEAPRLSLEQLVSSGGSELEIAEILGELHEVHALRFRRHIAGLRDLTGLIKAYKLRFRIGAWLEEQLRALSLPTRLGTPERGPGVTPEEALVAAGGQESRQALSILSKGRGDDQVDLLKSDIPFGMTVRRRMAGLPWGAIPNLRDYMAAWSTFEDAAASGEGPAGIPLISTDLLRHSVTDPLVKAHAESEPDRVESTASLLDGRRNGEHQLASLTENRA